MSRTSTPAHVSLRDEVFDPIRYKIIELLANKEMRIAELAVKLKLPDSEVESHVNELYKAKLVIISRVNQIKDDSVQKWYTGRAFNVIQQGKAAELLINPITSQILALLVQGEMPLHEISKSLRISKAKARYHVLLLIGGGLVVKTKFTEIRGMKVPWFTAKWKVSIPRLDSLPHEADVGVYLDSLKAFIWGYLVGLGMSDEKIRELMLLQERIEGKSSSNINSTLLRRTAKTAEQLADESEQILGSSPDVLKFQLIAKAIKSVLSEPQFQEFLVNNTQNQKD